MKPKFFVIPVTQHHIDTGVQSSTNLCMKAKAVNDEIGATHLSFRDGLFKFNLKGFRYYCEPTTKMREQIAKFDEDKSLVKPFTFTLKVLTTKPVITRIFTGNPSSQKRKKSTKKRKICSKTRFTSGSYNKKLKESRAA